MSDDTTDDEMTDGFGPTDEVDDHTPMVTASGKVLSDEDVEYLSTQAELGYERDPEGRWGSNMNKLLGTTDAREWAAAFEHQFRVSPNPDEGTMLAWFACALETGRTAGRQEMCPHPRDGTSTYGDMILCLACGKNISETVDVGEHL